MRSSCQRVGITGLTVVVLLTGCLGPMQGPDPGDLDEPPASDGAGESPDATAARFNLTFPEAQSRRVQHQVNGTFLPHEHNFPLGFVLSQGTGSNPADQLVDIKEDVPVNIPTTVTMDLRWEPNMAGALQLRFHPADGDEVYSWEETSERETGSLKVTLSRTHAGPLLVGVRYNSPDAQDEVSYSLGVTIETHDDRVPVGVPVFVTVRPDHDSLFVSLGEDSMEARFLLWDGEDRFLGRFNVPEQGILHRFDGKAAGDYVLMAVGAGSLRVALFGHTDEEPGPMRPAGQVETRGDPVVVEPNGETDWAFEVDRVPLVVSLVLQESVVLNDWEGSVVGPEGEVLKVDNDGTFFLSDWWWESSRGGSGLVEGSYEARWENTAAVEVVVTHSVVYYAR